MADYRLSAKLPLSRGKGQSAIAKAAYNSRSKLTDERTGEVKDFSRLKGLIFSGIFPGSRNAPEWVQDRGQLWNKANQAEKRKDARLAQEIEISLPHEMSDQQREWLVKDFVREAFTRKGITADVAIHEPSKRGDDRNYHAHILLTVREIGPDGFGKKLPERDAEQIERWREQWAHLQNRHLERHGYDARVDHRSLEAQGIDREPTRHRGPHVDAIERRGIVADKNREETARRSELAELKAELSNINRDIAAVRNELAAANQNQREILAEVARSVPELGPQDLGGVASGLKSTVDDALKPLAVIAALLGDDKPAPPPTKEAAEAQRRERLAAAMENLRQRDRRRLQQDDDKQKRMEADRQREDEDQGGRSRQR